MTSEPSALRRFQEAQDADGTWARALAELAAGRKRTHWMWFVFPQVAGLGSSGTARRFAIASLDEAAAYLADPTLGPRLRTAAHAAEHAPAPSAEALLGTVDAMKLRSSMTLFGRAAPTERAFRAVLTRWFDGREDERTLSALRSARSAGLPSGLSRTSEGARCGDPWCS